MVVNERMICHAIIGKNPLKERIMTVDVTAKFIAPLLEFSSKRLLFSLYQVRYVAIKSLAAYDYENILTTKIPDLCHGTCDIAKIINVCVFLILASGQST